MGVSSYPLFLIGLFIYFEALMCVIISYPCTAGGGEGGGNFEIFFKNQDTQKHYSKFDLLLEFIENSKLQDPFELLN